MHRTKLNDSRNPTILADQALGACLSPYNDFFNLHTNAGSFGNIQVYAYKSPPVAHHAKMHS